MNWGKGILTACALFIGGIGFMVYTSATRNVDLVAANYYEREIKYQEHIDKINNTNKAFKKINIELTPGNMVIIFPNDEIPGKIKGDISFYKPSDAKMDFSMPVNPDGNSKQIIPLEKLGKGMWKVMVNWSPESGIEYYFEERVIIE